MPDETANADPQGPERAGEPLDTRIAALAHRQHGVVSGRQLVALGLGERSVRKRAAAGRLHRVHRGVYAVGRPGLTVQGIYAAAVLAGGPGAALGEASAAHHRDLLAQPCTHPVHVRVPGRAGGRRRGIAAHTGPAEATLHDGIPTATIARTILDLAANGKTRLAERAIDRANEVHRYDFALLRALLEEQRGAPGTAVVARLLEVRPHRTRSGYEEAFLALCRGYGLPEPRSNLWIALPGGHGLKADFAWPRDREAVEVDSLTFHGTPEARDADYRKQNRLRALGWEPLRFTELQVTTVPAYVAATVSACLG